MWFILIYFDVIGVSIAATRPGGSRLSTPTTTSHTKELPIQGKQGSNPEGYEYVAWTMFDKISIHELYTSIVHIG